MAFSGMIGNPLQATCPGESGKAGEVKRIGKTHVKINERGNRCDSRLRGKKGGEFYTPRCVVKLLVEMLEPYRGRAHARAGGDPKRRNGNFLQAAMA
jgi:hypothetical protein